MMHWIQGRTDVATGHMHACVFLGSPANSPLSGQSQSRNCSRTFRTTAAAGCSRQPKRICSANAHSNIKTPSGQLSTPKSMLCKRSLKHQHAEWTALNPKGCTLQALTQTSTRRVDSSQPKRVCHPTTTLEVLAYLLHSARPLPPPPAALRPRPSFQTQRT